MGGVIVIGYVVVGVLTAVLVVREDARSSAPFDAMSIGCIGLLAGIGWPGVVTAWALGQLGKVFKR